MNLHEKIAKIAHELEEQYKSLKKTEDEFRLLHAKNAKLDKEVQTLSRDKIHLETEKDSLRDHVSMYEEMIGTERKNAMKIKETLETKLTEMEKRIQFSENNLLEVTKDRSEVKRERDNLRLLLEEEKVRIHELEKNEEEQRKNLQETGNNIKQLQEEIVKLFEESERLKSEKMLSETELNSLKEKVEQYQEKIEVERIDAANTKDVLEVRLKETEGKLGLQENELNRVTQEKDLLKRLVEDEQRKTQEVRMEIATYDERIAKLDSEKKELEAKLEELEAKAKFTEEEFSKMQEAKDAQRSLLNKEEEKTAELQEKVVKLEAEKAELKSLWLTVLEDQQKNLQATENLLRILKDGNPNPGIELQEVYNKKIQLEILGGALRDQINFYREIIGADHINMIKIKETLETKLTEMEERIQPTEKNLLEVTEDRDKLRSLLEEEQEKTEQLRAKLDKLESVDIELHNLQIKLDEEKRNLKEAEKDLELLQDMNTKINERMELLKNRFMK